jgi:hypothetical protein
MRFSSKRTREFKAMLGCLPQRVQKAAQSRYREYFLKDPNHPLLKRHALHDVGDARPGSFAVEIYYGFRAVGFLDEAASCYVWYWCGSHAEYDTRFRKGR